MTEAFQKSVQVLPFRIAPLQLTQRGDTRHHLPFHFHAVLCPFRPDASLHSDDILLFFRGQLLRLRLEHIYAFYAADAFQAVITRIAEVASVTMILSAVASIPSGAFTETVPPS